MPTTLTIPDFVRHWKQVALTEKAASQSHFIDLCRALGEPTPTEADTTGDQYTFEKGVTTIGGRHGWADVWKQGHFAWEYKRPHEDLDAAYRQLLQYREDLENPPLLVVSDLLSFRVHTNFTNTVKRTYQFSLDDLLASKPTTACPLPPLDVLRSVFETPDYLHPRQSVAYVTEAAAEKFARLAIGLRRRGVAPQVAAHFLMRLLFCLFAEDIGLLPKRLFTELVELTRMRPLAFSHRLRKLFAAMATGGEYGNDDIRHFDGGLFNDDTVFDLDASDLVALDEACQLDWSSVEPVIFGTLFERGLDPDNRTQLGAHYTSKHDILLITDPVLMAPLRRRWSTIQGQAQELASQRDKALGVARSRHELALKKLLFGFEQEIAHLRVLDPACGSGNFLYVALKQLLDLEKEVGNFATRLGLPRSFPQVAPEQLYGIEINSYAQALASVVVWIGYIQWLRENGFGFPADPVLRPLPNIQQLDAILAEDAHGQPIEPAWPQAEVMIGNPPFLGDKKMRGQLGEDYVQRLRTLYSGRVAAGADLVTYWFERARAQVVAGSVQRVGLLATNSIRSGANRRVLERIKETGDIFMAWSDRPWVLAGAAVRVSMVGFDAGQETERHLDDQVVSAIHADLRAGINVTTARPLAENKNLCFLGMTKAGPFDIDAATAAQMLQAPLNPNGRPNTDVVKRRLGGQDIGGRPRDGWVIDYGVDTPVDVAALYELPFEYVRKHVKPVRDASRSENATIPWWLHARPRPALRHAIASLRRCIVTPEVAKYRLFIWMPTDVVPDHKLHVIARDDDYFLGVLHSRVHEVWSLAQCSWMGVGNDPSYSSSRTFETFPFPWCPGKEPTDDPRVQAVAAAARDLVMKRDAWLNPPSVPEDALAERTLTNLYNARATWLAQAHTRLDTAVLVAYGWPADLIDEHILDRLLALNQLRAGSVPTSH